MKYYHPINSIDNFILSIDGIIFDTRFKSDEDRNVLMRVIDNIDGTSANIQSWDSFRIGTFHLNLQYKLSNGSSFWMGIGLNTPKGVSWDRVRLDFNPNKVGSSQALRTLLDVTACRASAMHSEVKRFDLAIDMELPRESFFLLKDGRTYFERRHGSEWTQYLGSRSRPGRVKLYNKQAEAKLSYPLTRLELTLSPAIPYEKINFPKIFYMNNPQIVWDELRITDTEHFILGCLLNQFGSTRDLGRKTREKMEILLANYVKPVSVTKEDYTAILRRLDEYSSLGRR